MKIPKYTAQERLTTEVPAVRFSAESAGLEARAMGQVGDVITQLGEKIRQVRKADEIGKANIAASESIRQIEIDAANDTDLNEYQERYDKRLEKARKEIMSGIKDREAAQEFGQRFSLKVIDTKFNIRQMYNRKAIDSARATLNTRIDQLQEEYIRTGDPGGKERKLDEIAEALNVAGVTGLMTRESAQKSFSKIKKELPEKQVEWDIYNDTATDEKSSIVLNNLRDKTKYTELSSESRLEMIKKSQTRIFQNNQTYKREVKDSQNIKYEEFVNKLIDGTLTYKDLDTERNIPQEAGGLPPSKIENFRKKLETQVTHDLKVIVSNDAKANDYVNFISRYIDDKTDRSKALEYVADAYSDGLLSQEEARYLTQLKKYMADVKWHKTADSAINGMKWFFKWLGRNSTDDKDAAAKVKKFLSGMQESSDPETDSLNLIESEIRRTRLEKYPWMSTLPKEGEMRIMPDGTKKTLYPDGKIE